MERFRVGATLRVTVAPGVGLDLAFPPSATAVGTHRL